MLTVNISVNGKTVYARSARNTKMKGFKKGEIEYITDSNNIVSHNPDQGIIKLAIKILKTIKGI